MKTLLSFWHRFQETNLFVELNLASLVLLPLFKKLSVLPSAARAFPSSLLPPLWGVEVPTSRSTNPNPPRILFT